MKIQYSQKIDSIIYSSGIFGSMTQNEKIDLVLAILDQLDINAEVKEKIELINQIVSTHE